MNRKFEQFSIESEPFFGRGKELTELKDFLADETVRIFELYGVPMIGKTTLLDEFLKTVENYETQPVPFQNPENPEDTLDKLLFGGQSSINWQTTTPKLIIFQNFEEALQRSSHEIKSEKIKQVIIEKSQEPFVKIILESRFRIILDFLPPRIHKDLNDKQLGRIDRKELFEQLNKEYRHDRVSFEAFERLCEKFNDHIWLIKFVMRYESRFEDVLEAVDRPQSVTQMLWDKIRSIIKRLPSSQKTLLCAFAVVNPMPQDDLEMQMKILPVFQKHNKLDDDLASLRKKLLVTHSVKSKSYELNSFLREVCFTFLKNEAEMQTIKNLPYFSRIPNPEYDAIRQAHEQGNYGKFFKLIKEMRWAKKYDQVFDALREALSTKTNPMPEGILNEIGVTYKARGNYDEAISTFKNLIEEYNHVPAYNELATIYVDQKNYKEAIRIFKKLIIEHRHLPAYNELATIYKGRENHLKAIRTLKKALEVNEKDTKTLNQLAIIYRELNNYKEAVSLLERADEIDSRDVKTLNELAVNYIGLRNFDKATNAVIRGLEKEPYNPYLLSALKRLPESDKLREFLESKTKSEEKFDHRFTTKVLVKKLSSPEIPQAIKESKNVNENSEYVFRKLENEWEFRFEGKKYTILNKYERNGFYYIKLALDNKNKKVEVSNLHESAADNHDKYKNVKARVDDAIKQFEFTVSKLYAYLTETISVSGALGQVTILYKTSDRVFYEDITSDSPKALVNHPEKWLVE